MMGDSAVEESVDQVLDLLSKPLSRYILSVLAGIDPGVYNEPIAGNDPTQVGDDRTS